MRTRLRSSRVIDGNSTPITKGEETPPADTEQYNAETFSAPVAEETGYDNGQPASQEAVAPAGDVDFDAIQAPSDADLMADLEQMLVEQPAEAQAEQPEPVAQELEQTAPVTQELQPEPEAQPEPAVQETPAPSSRKKKTEQPARPSAPSPPVYTSAPSGLALGQWIERQLPAYQSLQQQNGESVARLLEAAGSFTADLQAQVDQELAVYAQQVASNRDELDEMRQSLNALRAVMGQEQQAHLDQLIASREAEENRLAQERKNLQAEIENMRASTQNERQQILKEAYLERDRLLEETRKLSSRLGDMQKMMQGLFGDASPMQNVDLTPPEPVIQPSFDEADQLQTAPAGEQYADAQVDQLAEPEVARYEQPTTNEFESLREEIAGSFGGGNGLAIDEPPAQVAPPIQEPEPLVEQAATPEPEPLVDEPYPPVVDEPYPPVVEQAAAPEPEPEPEVSKSAPAARGWRTDRKLSLEGVHTLTLASNTLDQLEQNSAFGEVSLISFENGKLIIYVRHAPNFAIEQVMTQELQDNFELIDSDDETIRFRPR